MEQEKTGALIAQKRREKGMTQIELASRLSVSNKAVSRWETGAGFPDVSILERLAAELGITVTALLSGEEEAAPEEKLVVESTRQFSKELTDKKKRYRRICIIAVTLIAVAAAAVLYVGRHKGLTLLPRKDTVITYEPKSEKESVMEAVTSSRSFYFNVVHADDLDKVRLSLELWDGDGLRQTWDVMGLSGFSEMEREGSIPLVVSCTVSPEDYSKLNFSVFYYGGLGRANIQLPYAIDGYGYGALQEPEHVATGSSAILLDYSFSTNNALYSPQFLGQPESIEPCSDEVALLLRISLD